MHARGHWFMITLFAGVLQKHAADIHQPLHKPNAKFKRFWDQQPQTNESGTFNIYDNQAAEIDDVSKVQSIAAANTASIVDIVRRIAGYRTATPQCHILSHSCTIRCFGF